MAPSLWQLLIVLGIVILVFGTRKLGNLGGDLGSAIRNFKQSMRQGEAESRDDAPRSLDAPPPQPPAQQQREGEPAHGGERDPKQP